MNLWIAGLPASGMIVALVEGAKRLGMPPRCAPALAVTLGVLWALAAYMTTVAPRFQGWYDAVGTGVVLGLTAAGLYSGARAVVARAEP